MEWGKTNLSKLNRDDIYFAGMGEDDKGKNAEELDPNGKSKIRLSDKASTDFALLASCNHTIASRGTYTIWASRFAGGDVFTEFNMP